MALILKDGSLYLHIPKTGGNWMTDTLERMDLVAGSVGHKHATYDHVCGVQDRWRRPPMKRVGRLLRKRMASVPPSVLCVVRHPLRWYESWFRYQTGRGWPAWGVSGDLLRWHPCHALEGCDRASFNGFMRDVNTKAPGFASRLFLRYTEESGAVILKNESLRADLARYFESRGIAFDREIVASSPTLGESPKMTLDWDPDILRETHAAEAAGLRLFGYSPLHP